MKIRCILIGVFIIIGNYLSMGQIELSQTMRDKLEMASVAVAQPTENQFKQLRVSDGQPLVTDFVLRHKKDKVEVRYLVEPDTGMIADSSPHIRFASRAMHLAKNDEESILSIIQLSKKQLSEKYQADWGATAFFSPKESFAQQQHCKMTVLYKQGQGYIYTFCFFDKVNLDLGERFELVYFVEEIE